jgi:hypothetical protein
MNLDVLHYISVVNNNTIYTVFSRSGIPLVSSQFDVESVVEFAVSGVFV